MNLSPHWVERLNAAGLPAVHWSTLGRVGAPDTEIMAYAANHDYVVVTHDLDLSRVKTAAESPYSLSLARRMASASSFARMMATTGPKLSSRYTQWRLALARIAGRRTC
jgi:predicted nuclease of predicted toxin-antitoxin system